ncbi:tRNA (cytosine(38)-C(5))-methyltransferase [Teleopsis dalmanni]|uniref:tRNA (cytosine(38)-C(5))-methyltransferase n=1 Tax=Teleopsis dalmanni TaxID=139649 RepID=UPI0018CF7AE0|nr:tRNA (cytosine(38)-C(5))-methyltransferase [Teleopsis dalmanni]
MEKMEEFRVLELFSGIGGMHYAFKYSNLPGEIVAAIDINTVANAVYAYNHEKTPLLNNNIQRLNLKTLEKLNINTILMSPPCQPHTRQHLSKQRDIEDNRSDALRHLCQLIPEYKNLQYVLLENVKDFQSSQSRNCFIDALKSSGFQYSEFIISPTQFGIPNTRHRYYCIARKYKDFPFDCSHVLTSMPNIKTSSKNSKTIEEFLDVELTNETSYNSTLPEKILRKYVWLLDIVTKDSNNSACFTKAYTHYSEGTGSVFTPCSLSETQQIFEKLKSLEKDDSEIVERLRLEMLQSLKLRYFSPSEVSRLMCFPASFNFPKETTTRQKYRLLGNSINVLVVAELLKLLCS